MAQRPAARGTFGLRAMLSIDPATVGKRGYPLLLQTGETADGRTPLIDRPRAAGSNWQSTLAWGRNAKDPGDSTNAALLESTLRTGRHTFFGRGETARKDELFESGPHAHEPFDVVRSGHLALGVGGLGSLHFVPAEIEHDYGSRRPRSFMLFVRGELR